MRLNAPITEISTQPIALENCDDTFVGSKQIDALLEQDIRAYATSARIGGAVVRFTQLQNPSAHDPTPLIIGNGFCGSEGAYKGLSVETALRGRNVTFVKPPRIQSPCGVINVKHLRDPLLVQEQALWLAGRTSMHRLDCDQFDEYGHSLGGVTTTAVALHKIGRIRKLILAGSAGIDGRHNLLYYHEYCVMTSSKPFQISIGRPAQRWLPKPSFTLPADRSAPLVKQSL
jgi:pimeloyl-ACP methyl ester carboxylesterase